MQCTSIILKLFIVASHYSYVQDFSSHATMLKAMGKSMSHFDNQENKLIVVQGPNHGTMCNG